MVSYVNVASFSSILILTHSFILFKLALQILHDLLLLFLFDNQISETLWLLILSFLFELVHYSRTLLISCLRSLGDTCLTPNHKFSLTLIRLKYADLHLKSNALWFNFPQNNQFSQISYISFSADSHALDVPKLHKCLSHKYKHFLLHREDMSDALLHYTRRMQHLKGDALSIFFMEGIQLTYCSPIAHKYHSPNWNIHLTVSNQ